MLQLDQMEDAAVEFPLLQCQRRVHGIDLTPHQDIKKIAGFCLLRSNVKPPIIGSCAKDKMIF